MSASRRCRSMTVRAAWIWCSRRTGPSASRRARLGDAIVCSVRYVPKSGYRKGRKDIEYLKSVTGMEIWFAKTATLKLYAPVYAKIPTRYGTVHVTAEKFDG